MKIIKYIKASKAKNYIIKNQLLYRTINDEYLHVVHKAMQY
jgi:hypothetical protein